MKISATNGQANTSQLSYRSFPDSVLLLDIVQMSEKRTSLYFQHRLDNLSSDNKRQLLKEHTTLKSRSKNLGLDPKSQLPLKSKVPEHRWIISTDKASHAYILLIVSNTPETFVKRLQRRLQGKVAQVTQKHENFHDSWIQDRFSEVLDSFNEALKKQHLSDFLSSSEFEATAISVEKSKADVEQQLEYCEPVEPELEAKPAFFKHRIKIGTLKLALIVMVGLFFIFCLLHRFTAPQHPYHLKRKTSRK